MKQVRIAACCAVAAGVLLLTGCGDSRAKNSNRLGEEAMAEGKYKEAVTAFKQAVAYDNTCAEYYVNQGMAYLGLDDTENAMECFTHAVSLDEENMQAYRGMGIAYMNNKSYLDAIEAFNTAVSYTGMWVNELDYDILEYRAEAEMLEGMTEDAQSTYSGLIELGYHLSDNYYRRGVIELMLHDHDAAMDDFSAAIQQDAGDYSLYIDIYYSLCDYEYTEEAQTFLNKAVEVAGTSDEDYLARGEIYFQQQKYQDALAALELVEALEQNGQLYLTRAACCVGLEEYEEAAAQYDAYIAGYGEDARVMNELAVCRIKQGLYSEAVDILTRALQREGAMDIPEIKWNLIVAYEEAGELELAYATAAEYAANYPEDENAQAEYVYLQNALGIYVEE